jgi:hypothetical protein
MALMAVMVAVAVVMVRLVHQEQDKLIKVLQVA